MKLYINDANILIDIVQLELIDAFFSLDFELYTTDFVFEEINEEQRKSLLSERLTILKSDETEIYGIFELMESHRGLSFQDCSVWYYAREIGATLITGDGKLRKCALSSGLDVKGIIFIIEEIKNQKILQTTDCINKLEKLKSINCRLPVIELDNRIKLWENELRNNP